MSELKVNKLSPASGTAFTLGDSGDTFTIPSGATFTNSGTATGFGSAGPTLGTPVASTSGTAIDFTSIPAGTKSITIACSGVSTTGSSRVIVQIGDAGGIESSGYLGTAVRTGIAEVNPTDGFGCGADFGASVTFQGIAHLILLDAATFTWVYSAKMGRHDTYTLQGAGAKSLSAELDRVRITTQGGSNTFDAGKINIQYE